MMRQRRRGHSYFYFPKSSVPWEKTLGDNSKFRGTKFWALSSLRHPGERRYEGVNIITLQHYYIKVCVRDRHMEERDRHIHRHRCEHPQRSEQDVRSPRAGVTGSRETFGCWELESSRLAGSQAPQITFTWTTGTVHNTKLLFTLKKPHTYKNIYL